MLAAQSGGFAFLVTMRTGLYVDGFNLYYGVAKHTSNKWLNVVALAETVLPGMRVDFTRYFTALVKSSSADPQQRQRQETYIRALETLPQMTVHHGHYLRSECMMPLVEPPPKFARVIKMEEKGSDVNLATYLLVDAFQEKCDQFVVVTNDSDLAEPIRIVKTTLGKRVLVLNPHSEDTAARASIRAGRTITAKPSIELRKVSYRVKNIRDAHARVSQFEPTLLDSAGRTISRPTGW